MRKVFQRIFLRVVLPLAFALGALTVSVAAKDIWVYQSGAWHVEQQPSIYQGGAYHNWKGAWIYQSGAWQPFYSTITVSASNASGSGSGASSSGSVSTSSGPSTVTGGTPIGTPTFSWAYVSGDSGISVNNSTLQNPIWNKTISGVGCSSSSNPTAVWRVTATDPATGRQAASSNITVSLTWNNTTSCFTPFNQQFTSGSGSVTVPTGASSLTIYVVGGGGKGGSGRQSGDPGGGGGGGSGGNSSITRAISSGDWGGTLGYSVGAGSTGANAGTSTSSGSVAAGSAALSSTGGSDGQPGAGGGGSGGAGGTPAGNSGSAGGSGSSGLGGSGGAAPRGDGYGAGGKGGNASGSQAGTAGVGGEVIFQWS